VQIHTQNVIILPPTATADAMASMERLMQSIGRAEAPAVAAARLQAPDRRLLARPGGFYAGDMRGDDGTVYGLIVADCGDAKDVGSAKWARMVSETCPTGMAWTTPAAWSTNAPPQSWPPAMRRRAQGLLPASPPRAAAGGRHVPHLFGTESWYWSSTHYGQSTAWAVDFEDGSRTSTTGDEFRVRPVRRFIY
jgi:hypothetical protein